MALITAAVAQQYVSQLTNVDATQLSLLLEVASNQLESICQRKFPASDYHEEQTGDSSRETFIKNPPILRFDSVEYFDPDAVKYLNSGIEFCLNEPIGHVRFKVTQSAASDFDRFYAADLNNIVVNYRGGFETIPNDLAYLVAWWTYGLYQESQSAVDLKSESLQEYSYQRSSNIETNLPQHARDILNVYRLIDPM